jgi:uncharacterized protein with PIN domain
VRLYTDAMLGTLTTSLRFLGHDTVYALDEGAEADRTCAGDSRQSDERSPVRPPHCRS